jgi:hypothetical protein
MVRNYRVITGSSLQNLRQPMLLETVPATALERKMENKTPPGAPRTEALEPEHSDVTTGYTKPRIVIDNDPNDDSEGSGGAPAVAMVRPHNDSPDPSEGKFVVLFDRRSRNEDDGADEFKRYFLNCLERVRPIDAEEFKAGAVLCDKFELEIDSLATAWLLSLAVVDKDMKRAVTAALFSGFLGTVGPVDLEVATRVLGSFIHAHPRFANEIRKATWNPPFDEHTGIFAARVGSKSK